MKNKVDEMLARFGREATPKWGHTIEMTNEVCDYCKLKTPKLIDSSGGFNDISIEHDDEGWWIVQVIDQYASSWYSINYCPMCGRKL